MRERLREVACWGSLRVHFNCWILGHWVGIVGSGVQMMGCIMMELFMRLEFMLCWMHCLLNLIRRYDEVCSIGLVWFLLWDVYGRTLQRFWLIEKFSSSTIACDFCLVSSEALDSFSFRVIIVVIVYHIWNSFCFFLFPVLLYYANSSCISLKNWKLSFCTNSSHICF